MTNLEINSLKPVSLNVTNAFFTARAKYRDLHTAWIELSARLAGRFSLLEAMMSLQRQGDADLLIRCLEDEFSPSSAHNSDATSVDFAFHYQLMLSEAWIIGCYEILRALKQRSKEAEKAEKERSSRLMTASFQSLFADFELLRMPIAKYEIPKEQDLKQPLVMKSVPPNDDTTDEHIYDRNDPTRRFIMPTTLSCRGSAAWMAHDHRIPRSYWIERRDLSDRLLSLLNEIEPADLRAGRLEAERGK